MPQKLIGVMSCHKETAHRQMIRKTWGAEVPASWDLKFFLGMSSWVPEEDPEVLATIGPAGTLGDMHPTKRHRPALSESLLPDEVGLDCPDCYLGTAWKGRAIQRWAIDHEYAGLFLCCSDTVVFPARLERACQGHDCVGQTFTGSATALYPHRVPCPHGGFGYYLSQKTLRAIYNEPVRHYSEDQSTAQALHHQEIKVKHSASFVGNRLLGGLLCSATVSQHISTKAGKFEPQDIKDAWDRGKTALKRYPDFDGVCKNCQGVKFKMGLYGPQCFFCGWRYR